MTPPPPLCLDDVNFERSPKVLFGHHYDPDEWYRCAALEENRIPADEVLTCSACDKEIRRKRGKTMFETIHQHQMTQCPKYLYRKTNK